MGIALRQGRIFAESDRDRVVAVISENMARRLWPGRDPIGQRIRHGGEEASPIQIVGVVGDIRNSALDKEPGFVVYQPYWQHQPLAMSLAVRTAAELRSIAAGVRSEIRQLEPEMPVPGMRTMEQAVAESVSRRHFQMLLLGIFAAVALLLAAVGIYGVMSYSVSQRRHEIGIRLALGAERRDIFKLVVGQGAMLALIGVGIGLAAALVLTRLMSSLLFSVSATDPLTFASIAVSLTAVALLACYLPARRATKVDPMVALRYE